MKSLKKNRLEKLVEKYPTYESLIEGVFEPLIGAKKEQPDSNMYILDNAEEFIQKYNDFKSSFKLLEELTGYKLGKQNAVKSESMMKALMHNTKRFYGTATLDFADGGNTGQHAFFASILSLYNSINSGLLEGTRREINEKLFLTETEMKMINIHDNGEFQEFGSVSTDSKGMGKDLVELERKAFEKLNHTALYLLQENNSRIEAVELFYNIAVKAQLRLMEAQNNLREGIINTEEFLLMFESEVNNLEHGELNDENQEILDERLSLFESVEGISYSRFYGLQNVEAVSALAKIIEKLEGTNHFTKNIEVEVKKDQSVVIPTFKIEDSLNNSQFKYLGGHLGKTYDLVENTNISEVERSFLIKKLDNITNRFYKLMLINCINGPAIANTNIDINDEIKFYKNGANRKDLMRANFNKVKEFCRVNPPQNITRYLPEIKKQSDLVYLYKKAIEVNYKPKTGEILAFMTKLPKELQFTAEDKRRYNVELQKEFPELYKNGIRRNMWLEDKKIKNPKL